MNRSHAVMAQRHEPPDSLDFFPTPPWSTRALIEKVLRPEYAFHTDRVWEPACGEGHMAEVLKEYFGYVLASDVFDYGYGYPPGSFDFLASDVGEITDWIITNPPFKVAEDFALRGLERARIGVALLVRSVWLEGTGRYARLFKPHPPTIITQFCERVPMTKGRWDPDASTATSYAWVVWVKQSPREPVFRWIPPGCRQGLTKPTDRKRFAVRTPTPLFDDKTKIEDDDNGRQTRMDDLRARPRAEVAPGTLERP